MSKGLILSVIVILVVLGLILVKYRHPQASPVNVGTSPPTATTDSTDETVSSVVANASPQVSQPPSGYVDPIADFRDRVTKKTFGMYIDPKTSPVQPERFHGYHTGDDVEYQDVTADVPVKAIADGTVVISGRVSGYGGLILIKHTQGTGANVLTFTSVYGHLKVSSLVPVGTKVTAGQQIAVLGANKSADTDGERRHLHFGILKGDSRELRGYVQNKSELNLWYDPLQFMSGK